MLGKHLLARVVACGMLVVGVVGTHAGNEDAILRKYVSQFDCVVVSARDSLRLPAPITEEQFDELDAAYEMKSCDRLTVALSADLLMKALAEAKPFEREPLTYTVVGRVDLMHRGAVKQRIHFHQDGVVRVGARTLMPADRRLLREVWSTVAKGSPVADAGR